MCLPETVIQAGEAAANLLFPGLGCGVVGHENPHEV
jgi:hypothetical protein